MAGGLLDNIVSDLTGIGLGPDLSGDIFSSLANFGVAFAQGADEVQGGNIFDGLPQMEGAAVPVEGNPAAAAGMAADAGDGKARQAQQFQQANVAQQAKMNQQLAAQSITQPDSRSRFYNRKLYRAILGQRGGSQEDKIQARLALRIQGAPTPDANQGMGPAPGTVFSKESRAQGLTPQDQWDKMFPPRRQAGETLPPPVSGGDWSSMFRQTRANNFGAGTPARPDTILNPKTGQLESTLPQKARDTQAIIDDIMRLSDLNTQHVAPYL